MPADIISHGMMKTFLSHTDHTFSMDFQLIMKIYDDKRNWIFENVGIEKAESLREMYLYKRKDIIKTSENTLLPHIKINLKTCSVRQ